MRAFDLYRMALDKMPMDFLGEATLRSLYTFILVFLLLKITGCHDARRMSLFGVLITLTPGFAVGDVVFYDGAPMLSTLVVFITPTVPYRLVMRLVACSEKMEDLSEGKPVVIIEDDELAWPRLNSVSMTELEFFIELRLNGAEQLGQVKLAILETNRQINVYFFADRGVKPGLSILPKHCTQRLKIIPEAGDYAYIRCSRVVQMDAGDHQLCLRCVSPEWSKTSQAKRVIWQQKSRFLPANLIDSVV